MSVASEIRMLDSQHTGKTYQITISLPWAYDPPEGDSWPFNNAPKTWQTIYVPDGNWYTEMVAGMVHPVSLCGRTRDAIIVGVGYPQGDNAVEALRINFTRRTADLTPVRDDAEEQGMEALLKHPVPTGDSANFLKFLQNELIPMIERDFRSDPAKRILAGHSYGGLFGAYTLFEAPDLFETYIIGSPTLSYGDRFVFQQEETYARGHKSLPATVYLYAGDEEAMNDTTLTDTLRFATILESRNYENFTLKKTLFMDDNHCQVIVPGFHWGFSHALRK